MLGLATDQLEMAISSVTPFRYEGRLHAARGVVTARIPAAVRELCLLKSSDQSTMLAEVIGFENGLARLLPYSNGFRLTSDTQVQTLGRTATIPCGASLMGRILNGLGEPIDGKGPLVNCHYRNSSRLSVPAPLTRQRIAVPMSTGQRAIDGFLTLGLGQRVGLFAGSGVGKSTLLGEIAKTAQVDCNVIVLVGERGREVRPFVEDCLGPEGLERSVVIVATSDETPLMRIRAVQSAVVIADYLRSSGRQVLFMIDSLTRLAMAQREIGLLLGEPPTARGYTPSVFQLLANTLEQLGNSADGGITAIATVLIDADDMDDPIADSVRSIVDGHIVLDRRLAELGHFPAIDVSSSISRAFNEVTTSDHQQNARQLRKIMTTYNENINFVRSGAYEPGAFPELDDALRLMPVVNTILQQSINDHTPLEETLIAMSAVAEDWRH